MSDIKFACTQCGQHLVCEANAAGALIQCPNCGAQITIPQPGDQSAQAGSLPPPALPPEAGVGITDAPETASLPPGAGLTVPKPISGPPFARRAAELSCLCYIAIVILTRFGPQGPLMWATGVVECLAAVSGVVLAVIAFCGISRHGARGILIPAFAGLILNGLMLSIGVPNYFRARNRALAERQVEQQMVQTVQGVQKKVKESFNEGKIGSKTDTNTMTTLVRQLETASGQLTGDKQAMMKALAAWTLKARNAGAEMIAAQKSVEQMKALDVSTLATRQQLEDRRKALQHLLEIRAPLADLLERQGYFLKDELLRLKMDPQAADKQCATMQAELEAQPGYKAKIEAQVEGLASSKRIIEAQLETLDLLDQQWGRWTYDRARNSVMFSTPGTAQRYNDLMGELNKAAEEQNAAHKKMSEQY